MQNGKAMQPLVNLMNKTDKVRIVAKDTDLTFSIKDIPAVTCSGRMNIPDGEVYTAPVKNSVNGVIHYNAPSIENGFRFEDVRLVFKDGKIIEATANNSAAANAIFDTDEGARYVGEFAIGVNPYVKNAIGDILFDEKSAAVFILRRVPVTTTLTTATCPQSTGIWFCAKPPMSAAVKSTLTMC